MTELNKVRKKQQFKDNTVLETGKHEMDYAVVFHNLIM